MWPDGSIRWLLVQGQIPTDAWDTAWWLEPCDRDAESPATLRVTRNVGSITVDTGVARLAMQAGVTAFVSRVQDGESTERDADRSGLSVTDRDGAVAMFVPDRLDLEDEGPLVCTVVLAGQMRLGRHARLEVSARVRAWAGVSAVRVSLTIRNPNRARHAGGFWDLGDPGSVLIRDASFSLTGIAPAAAVHASVESGEPWTDIGVPFELYQDSSGGAAWASTNHLTRDRRVSTSFRGYRISGGGEDLSGLRATPAVIAGSLGIAVPEFWQNFPQAIEAVDRTLTWRMWPRQSAALHELQGGEQKTFECVLSFGPRHDDLRAWGRSRSMVMVDPGWHLAAGAVPFLAPLSAGHAELVNAAVSGADTFEAKREVIDEYGWRHFGEIYGDHEAIRQPSPPLVSHYNNQYDPVAGFIYQFLRTGDVRWWRMADELARHVIDIDVYHTDADKAAFNRGLFWHTYHYGDADTATHRTYPRAGRGRTHGGGPSGDHNYTTGLMLYYFLSGEPAARQTVIDLGQFVIDLDDGRKTPFRWLDAGHTGRATLSAGYYGPGRGPANSLNALVDAHRLSGETRFVAKAEQIVTRVVHPEEPVSRHRLDDPEQRWFYTMFFQSLGKYLHVKAERGEIDDAYRYARACLLHYADWMAEHEYPYLERPERLEFPTETWAAQDIRKSDVFHFAALHARSAEARRRFDARGRFFHRYSVETLAQMPTRSLARPVIVLLSSGFLQTWRDAHPDAAEPAPVGADRFEPQRPFEPQRARAMRKAKRLAIVIAAGTVLLALAIARALW